MVIRYVLSIMGSGLVVFVMLISGNIDHCQRHEYIFISADYRLCHPSTALDQIDDVKSLFNFLAGGFRRMCPSIPPA